MIRQASAPEKERAIHPASRLDASLSRAASCLDASLSRASRPDASLSCCASAPLLERGGAPGLGLGLGLGLRLGLGPELSGAGTWEVLSPSAGCDGQYVHSTQT